MSRRATRAQLVKRNSFPVKHGMTGTPTYSVWRSMINRCTNPRVACFGRYGGRGIAVCPEWRHSFETFLDDMGERPAGLSIERRDNDGDYCKANCRWATLKEQGRNKRSNCMLEVDGVSRPLSEWAELRGIDYFTLRSRIKRGWRTVDLFSPPMAGGHYSSASTARGERLPQSKLNASQVLAIRTDLRATRAIAADYGVSQTAVLDIKDRRSWSHV